MLLVQLEDSLGECPREVEDWMTLFQQTSLLIDLWMLVQKLAVIYPYTCVLTDSCDGGLGFQLGLHR
jgi:hypothetical protein